MLQVRLIIAITMVLFFFTSFSDGLKAKSSRGSNNIIRQVMVDRINSVLGAAIPRTRVKASLSPRRYTISPMHDLISPYPGMKYKDIVNSLQRLPRQDRTRLINDWVERWHTINRKFKIRPVQ